MRLEFCTVNQRMPALSKIRVCGSFASGSGILYSVTLPVFGSSLPTSAPVFPVYQMLPALSSTRPCGPEWGVLSGYSLTWLVLGSTRPSTFAICPVYQSEPSRAASGSCGLDRKSTRLNSSHSQISYAVFCLKKKKTNNVTAHLCGSGKLWVPHLVGTVL